jgi:hypothetical protein
MAMYLSACHQLKIAEKMENPVYGGTVYWRGRVLELMNDLVGGNMTALLTYNIHNHLTLRRHPKALIADLITNIL